MKQTKKILCLIIIAAIMSYMAVLPATAAESSGSVSPVATQTNTRNTLPINFSVNNFAPGSQVVMPFTLTGARPLVLTLMSSPQTSVRVTVLDSHGNSVFQRVVQVDALGVSIPIIFLGTSVSRNFYLCIENVGFQSVNLSGSLSNR